MTMPGLQTSQDPERIKELDLHDARRAISQLEEEWLRLNHDREKIVKRMAANVREQERLGRAIEELEDTYGEQEEDDGDPKF